MDGHYGVPSKNGTLVCVHVYVYTYISLSLGPGRKKTDSLVLLSLTMMMALSSGRDCGCPWSKELSLESFGGGEDDGRIHHTTPRLDDQLTSSPKLTALNWLLVCGLVFVPPTLARYGFVGTLGRILPDPLDD